MGLKNRARWWDLAECRSHLMRVTFSARYAIEDQLGVLYKQANVQDGVPC